MEFLDFNDIATYFQNKIEMIVYNLKENKQINESFDEEKTFVFFVNYGDYHKAVKDSFTLKDREFPPIPVLIKNAGGLQDPSLPIDVYLQKIEIEVYGWCDRLSEQKNQWHDVELILSYLCSELKGRTDSLLGNTIKTDMSDYPVLTELENKHFIALLNCNMHIMANASLSNNDKIVINGLEIPYSNFSEDLTVELIPDNKVTTEIKFMPNVYTYQLGMSGLYVNSNEVVKLMVESCTDGSLFAQPFGVDLIRDGIVLSSRTMFVKNFQIIRNYGSIIAYKATFYPAYTGE